MSPRKRSKGGAAASDSTSKSQPDIIPEDEQWRIISESKVLQQIPKAAADEDQENESPVMCEEILNAMLFIIPFSFVLLLMDM